MNFSTYRSYFNVIQSFDRRDLIKTTDIETFQMEYPTSSIYGTFQTFQTFQTSQTSQTFQTLQTRNTER